MQRRISRLYRRLREARDDPREARGHDGRAQYGLLREEGDKPFIIKSKKGEDGTMKFHAFLSSAIRAGRTCCTRQCAACAGRAAGRLRQGHPGPEPRVGGVLRPLARGWMFFSVAAMSEFGRADEYFLMYAKMTPGIKRALAEYEDGKRGAVSEYVVKSGRAKFTGVLAFVKKMKAREDGTRGRQSSVLFKHAAAPPRGGASRVAVRNEKEADARVGVSRRQDVKAHGGEQQPLDQDVHVLGIPCRCEHVGHDGPLGRH